MFYILVIVLSGNLSFQGSLKVGVRKELEERLKHWSDEVDRTMMKCKEAFKRCLDVGVRQSLESCESLLKRVMVSTVLSVFD